MNRVVPAVMQVRENLSMETETNTSFGNRRGFFITRTSLVLLSAFFVCSVIAAGFLIYNFVTCPQIPIESTVCEHHHVVPLLTHSKNASKTIYSKDQPHTTITTKDEVPYLRLPRSVVPTGYDIKLIPFIWPDNFTFLGDVRILVNILEPTNNITLHAETSIKIKSEDVGVRLVNSGNGTERKDEVIAKQYFEATKQFYVMEFQKKLQPGEIYEIRIKYVGVLDAYMQGFYRSSYVEGNETRWLAATQFQPTDARRTFPCFDEPVFGRGKEATRSADYALDVGPKLLKFLETFFGIDYPLPKVDMIALPDFTAGAMENWGLITFRESALLYEEGVSGRINKQRVATIVCHELAHQWFGNLVTPDWWDLLWLNEGFASYMEYVGVDAVEPKWKSMDQFVVHELQGVFTLDALSTSHKIWVEVGNPEEINEIFDRISYGKGATIIRMMDHFLTTAVFRTGLTNYLRKKSYQAASQDDLWFFFTEEARYTHVFDNTMSVKDVMDTWTLQTGFPVVTVTRDYNSSTVRFHQKKFEYADEVGKKKHSEKHSDSLWWIPITYTTSNVLNFNETRPSSWIRKTKELVLPDVEINNLDWIIVNVQQTGYYRVNYDLKNWNLIIGYLRNKRHFSKIAPTNRAQLIDDALNLARASYLSYQTALDVTQYLVHEHDYVPWKAAINSMNFIDSMMIKGGDYHLLKKYFLSLIESVYKEVGFDDPRDDDMLTGYKRVDILTAACHVGYQDCVDSSRRNYHIWMMEANPDINNPISPNIRSVVYCTAIKHGDQVEWEFAWERFQKTSVSSEKELLLTALGCTRETWLLNRYLKMSLDDRFGIRKHDVFRVFVAVSGNVIGQPIAFNFIRSHWKQMKDYLGSTLSQLNAIVKYCTRRINDRYELDEFKRFSHLHIKDGGRSIHQAIETGEANIAWMDNNYKTIVEWLGNLTYSNR
ncbi:hypothetical protein HA402_007941 [Bradysia odoriphaga]|nr:hypothetical protein HA402_007941 [Bradysia odoriphaga]